MDARECLRSDLWSHVFHVWLAIGDRGFDPEAVEDFLGWECCRRMIPSSHSLHYSQESGCQDNSLAEILSGQEFVRQ